jgi:hypothetical protein
MLPHLEDCFWLELIQPHIAGGKNQLVFRQILYTYLPFFWHTTSQWSKTGKLISKIQKSKTFSTLIWNKLYVWFCFLYFKVYMLKGWVSLCHINRDSFGTVLVNLSWDVTGVVSAKLCQLPTFVSISVTEIIRLKLGRGKVISMIMAYRKGHQIQVLLP